MCTGAVCWGWKGAGGLRAGAQKEGVQEREGKVIALYHRFNDEEDKWIVSLEGADYTDQEILEAIEFQKQYFEGILVR